MLAQQKNLIPTPEEDSNQWHHGWRLVSPACRHPSSFPSPVCVCVCVYILCGQSVCVCMYLSIYLSIYLYTYIYTCLPNRFTVCFRTCVCVHVYVYVYAHVYAYMHDVYAYMHANICISTSTRRELMSRHRHRRRRRPAAPRPGARTQSGSWRNSPAATAPPATVREENTSKTDSVHCHSTKQINALPLALVRLYVCSLFV